MPSLREDIRHPLSPCCDAPIVPGRALDPFLGSGTTLMIAKGKGLRGVGFELSPDFCEMAKKRITDQQVPLLVV